MLTLFQTTSRLLDSFPHASTTSSALGGITGGDLPLPSQAKIQRLNELATSKLSDIISHASAGDAYWQGYEQSEVISARQLLDREIQPIKR